MRIVFDDDLWKRTDPLRRAEWQAIVRDMLADPELRFDVEADTLRVAVDGSTTRLTLSRDDAPVATAAIPAADTRDVIESYIDVVRQIEKADQGLGSARIEALDMAKKLVHDDGARALVGHCATVGADHVTCRHLFTLLVALRVDTTPLAGLRGHRRVR